MKMEFSQAFDMVGFEKDKARCDFLRRIVGLRQILELVALLGLISWSTANVPAAAKTAAEHAVRISACLFNHHVALAFLIGNAIVLLLFLLFRRSDNLCSGEAAAHHEEPPHPPPHPPPPREAVGGGGEKTAVVSPLDDLSKAMEKAAVQVKRFRRTRSEKLRMEITVRPTAILRRTESENRRMAKRVVGPADMERLSSEEFQRTVDAFIDKHWSKKTTKQHGLV